MVKMCVLRDLWKSMHLKDIEKFESFHLKAVAAIYYK